MDTSQRGMYRVGAETKDNRWGLGSTMLLLGGIFGVVYVFAGSGAPRIQHDHPLYRRHG